jgi:hypothetical protein
MYAVFIETRTVALRARVRRALRFSTELAPEVSARQARSCIPANPLVHALLCDFESASVINGTPGGHLLQ